MQFISPLASVGFVFREQVAEHYRNKGYRLHEQVKIRGESGMVHACDLVAQGPLGNLVIQFEDEGGIEGPEVQAVGRAARDVGATGVLAIEEVPSAVRQRALQAGVVVLDAATLHAPPPSEPGPAEEPEYPPWPTGEVTRRKDPGIWSHPRRDPAPAPEAEVGSFQVTELPTQVQTPPTPEPEGASEPGQFGWLPTGRRVEPVGQATKPRGPAPVPEAKREALLGLRVVLLALLAGAVGGAVYFGLSVL